MYDYLWILTAILSLFYQRLEIYLLTGISLTVRYQTTIIRLSLKLMPNTSTSKILTEKWMNFLNEQFWNAFFTICVFLRNSPESKSLHLNLLLNLTEKSTWKENCLLVKSRRLIPYCDVCFTWNQKTITGNFFFME